MGKKFKTISSYDDYRGKLVEEQPNGEIWDTGWYPVNIDVDTASYDTVNYEHRYADIESYENNNPYYSESTSNEDNKYRGRVLN